MPATDLFARMGTGFTASELTNASRMAMCTLLEPIKSAGLRACHTASISA